MPKRRPSIDDRLNQQLEAAVRASRQKFTELAEALGCNRKTLYKWLEGTNAIPRDKLQRLCVLIHLPEEQRIEQFKQRGYPVPQMTREAPAPLPTPWQCRAPVSDFVGREREIAQIVATLESAVKKGAVAAISGVRGMGGVGKTELAYAVAQQLAEQFPDGQVVVALHGMRSDPVQPIAALQTVLHAFEREARLPDDLEALQNLYRSHLAGKRMLILADDARDVAQVRPLLPPAGCALLITSRQRFVLPGMMTLDLEALPAVEAERLIGTVCPRVNGAAGELAQLCGYLPLALRTSASLLASSDTRDLGRYLTQLEGARLQFLRDPDNPDDPQASVEASLALSYAALDAVTQATLCGLSVFPASFDLQAAAAVLDDEAETVELRLDLLRRRSVLEWDAGRERYGMHDLVRVFAQTRLGEADAVTIRQRHAAYFTTLAEQIETLLSGRGRMQGLERLDQETANLWQALQWAREAGEALLELQLATALVPFWIERVDIRRGYGWLQQALKASTMAPTLIRAKALAGLGQLARIEGELVESQSYYEQSLALFQETEQQHQEARVLFELGLLATDRGNDSSARAFFEASYSRFQHLGDRGRMGAALTGLGRIALNMGEQALGREHYFHAYTLLQESDNLPEYAWVQLNLGRLHTEAGEYEQALRYIEASLQLFRTLQDSQGIAWALFRKGLVLSFGVALDEATINLQESLAFFRRWGTKVGIAWCLYILSEVVLKQGNLVLAQNYAHDGIRAFGDLDYQPGVVLCLKNSAIAHMQTEPLRAVQSLALVERFRQSDDAVRRAIEPGSAFHDHVVSIARGHLDEAGFAAAWSAGQRLSLEEAIVSMTSAS